MGAERRVCRCVLGSQALSLEGIQTQFYANKLFSKGYRGAEGRPSSPLAKPGL